MAKIKGAETIDSKEPVEKENPIPVDAAPAAQPPPGTTVNTAFVLKLATDSLPKDADFRDYLQWFPTNLGLLRDQVITKSKIKVTSFAGLMGDAVGAIVDAEKALNEKSYTPLPAGPAVPPLPGVGDDPECASTFDANDLALRGKKALVNKRFYIPVVFPDVILDPAQTWRFGQKVEYRQEWRHEGFTLGPLVSSISLLPNEELTMEVSSWQRTKTEISQETDQEERKRQEREQRRTDEESTTNEAASNEGWQISGTASASYGPASASISAGYSSSTSQRTEGVERHITEATSKATNEISLKRAVKMTQSAEAGAEQKTTRRIRNPNTCHTVTFNFFQVVKLFDVQLRLENDAPTVMLPALFPAVYDDGKPVQIPYGAIEGFTSPANFLTQFFRVDRDVSEEIHGWCFRTQSDPFAAPGATVQQLTEALIVAVRYLLGLDPSQHVDELADFIANYVDQTGKMRNRLVNSYGPGRGRSEQIMTPGIYADSLLGRCTACETYVESSRYLDVVKQQTDIDLANLEVQRRQKRLDGGDLASFELAAPAL